MTAPGTPPPVGQLYRARRRERAGQVRWSGWSGPGLASVRAWTDNNVDLGESQKGAERALGWPFTPEELVTELSRLDPNRAAEIRPREGLRPAIQSVGEDRAWLSELPHTSGPRRGLRTPASSTHDTPNQSPSRSATVTRPRPRARRPSMIAPSARASSESAPTWKR